MLRVLHCVVGMNRGGIETLLMNLYRGIDRTRLQFDFLTSLPGAYDAEIAELGGQVHHIPFIDKVGPFAYAKSLREFFVSNPQYSIVHVHMDKFGGMLVREAHKSGVPVRILHSHNTKSEGGLAIRAVKGYYGMFGPKNSTHLFACGEAAAKWMFGRRAAQATILKNGVDLVRFAPADTREAGVFTIGHIGRFSQQKNHSFLLDIFAETHRRHPASRLLLAGEGAGLEAAKAKAQALGLGDAVRFLGAVADVAPLLASLDVFCLPSLFEGLPVTLVEAQAMGLPCLVSDTVSRESDITGDVRFLSLNQPAAAWAEALLACRGLPRAANTDVMEQAGYSISASAAKMQKFYLDNQLLP